MKSLVEFREHFGLTQTNLADYFSLSTSLLKMVEAGKRDLPLTAALEFARLQNFALDEKLGAEALRSFPDIETVEVTPRELTKSIRTIEVQLTRYQKQMEMLKYRYQQVLNRIALLTHLQQRWQEESITKRKGVLLQLLSMQNNVDIKRFGQPVRQILQWKIDCLRFSLEHAQKMVNLIVKDQG